MRGVLTHKRTRLAFSFCRSGHDDAVFSLAPVLFVRRRAAPHGRSVGRPGASRQGKGSASRCPWGVAVVGGWSRVEFDSMKRGWD